MTGVSILTIVRNREAHLRQLIEGLCRSRRLPDELVVVDMSDRPLTLEDAPFPIVLDRLETTGLPLAEARNRAAMRARHEHLVFLDVDCIPMAECVGLLSAALCDVDGVVCADVRYLGPGDARGAWAEADLLARGRAHPVRRFPQSGLREETNPGLFWSLAFAIHRKRFADLGGFDEAFSGYGGEDTDFGFRAAAAGISLYFLGGAMVCHQYHDSHEPPVQHVADIVRNAVLFHDRWGRWPMEGWLDAFHAMGLVDWKASSLSLLRLPTTAERASTLVADPNGAAAGGAERDPLPRVVHA